MEELTDDDLRAMIPDELVAAHRARALTPDRPVLRGTAQNPDAFFQAREACNPFYAGRRRPRAGVDGPVREDHRAPVQALRVRRPPRGGARHRRDGLRRARPSQETIDHLVAKGEKVGLVKVRLYRPFDLGAFMTSLPRTVHHIAVLDRTKEPGALGEPLYQDVVTALREAEQAHIDRFHHQLTVIGGRYGLSSKEFTPAHGEGGLRRAREAAPEAPLHRRHQRRRRPTCRSSTTRRSTSSRTTWSAALFYGLGADGTVGANKNSIKIIGEDTPNFAQGYFVYDSKKSGLADHSATCASGPRPIRSAYLITKANFVACHQFGFLEKYEMVENAGPGATFLLNSPYGAGPGLGARSRRRCRSRSWRRSSSST